MKSNLFNTFFDLIGSKKTTENKQLEAQNLNHFVLGNPLNQPLSPNEEQILFGCGCFWGAEKGFWKLPGIRTTSVGYAGGDKDQPTYNQVCSGNTGHAEVVRVVWDKSEIDLSDLLKMFWECHDPTQLNRQGNDQGSQYRSAIFTFNHQQNDLALASRDGYQECLTKMKLGKITTEIKMNKQFFFAEDYHQQYLARPGSRPYCSAMPTNIALHNFKGANFKLPQTVWSHFDWTKQHCVLRSNNDPIILSR